MNRLTNLTLILATVGWNYFTTSLPLNNKTLATLSDKYSTLINPASYAFSIWGFIYLGLIGFAIYQVLPSKRKIKVIDNIAPALWLNLLANGAWLAFFHYELIWSSLIAMLTVLATLIYINLTIHANRSALPNWIRWTFQVYFGWVAVATTVNFSSCFDTLNGSQMLGFNDRFWYFTILIFVTIITFFTIQKIRAFWFSISMVWAFVAIALNQPDYSDGLFYTPFVLAGLITIHAAMAALRGNSKVIY